MTLNGWLQILLFFGLVLVVTKPLGVFMARVFNRERTSWTPAEARRALIYRLTGVDERARSLDGVRRSVLMFSVVSMLFST